MLHDWSELLFDAITLLINGCEDKYKHYISILIEIMSEEKSEAYLQDKELVKGLMSVVNELLNLDDATDECEQGKLLAKFITNPAFTKQPAIQKSIELIFNSKKAPTKSKMHQMQLRIISSIRQVRYTKLAKSIYSNLAKAGDTNDEFKRDNILSNIDGALKEFNEGENRMLSATDISVIERIDMTDINALTNAVDQFKVSEVYGILKTPFQGFNTMCGERGGIALGESVNISALTHNYKSGFLRDLADGMVRYNTPSAEIEKIKPGIPLMLFISLENEANKNVVLWYKSIYAEKYGEFPKIVKETSSLEVAKYIADFYSGFGYRFIIERRLGTMFGFDEYCELMEEYEGLGYRVDAVFIDYMNQMKMGTRTNPQGGADYVLLRNLYNNMCNYNRTKVTAQISAHQLNREAANVANSGKRNVVKYFGGHLLANGIDVQREVDLEVYIHLEYNQYGTRFLTANRGKHRYVDNTPKNHQYFAYPFTPHGLVKDIGKEIGFVRDIYGVEAPDGYSDPNAAYTVEDSAF